MSESLNRLAHDLRGPTLTIQGFASELNMAVAELSRAVTQARETGGRSAADAVLARRVAEIVETDLEPCLTCISSAADTLAECIDELDVPADPRAA